MKKNKENTKRKLLDAVGVIIKTEGFSGLGVNKVANTAKVSKILIYRYFGGLPQLVDVYIQENQFWYNPAKDKSGCSSHQLSLREQVNKLLAERSHKFYDHCMMEAMLVNEMNTDHTNFRRPEMKDVPEESAECFAVMSKLLQAGTEHLLLTQPKSVAAIPEHSLSAKINYLLKSIGKIVEWALKGS